MHTAIHNLPGSVNFVVGPFPYIPNRKLIKLSYKLEHRYEKTNPKVKLILRRIEKKFASLERKFSKLRAA